MSAMLDAGILPRWIIYASTLGDGASRTTGGKFCLGRQIYNYHEVEGKVEKKHVRKVSAPPRCVTTGKTDTPLSLDIILADMAQAALKARKRSDYGFMQEHRTRWCGVRH